MRLRRECGACAGRCVFQARRFRTANANWSESATAFSICDPNGAYLSVGIVGRNGTKRYHCTVVDRSVSGLGVRFAKYVAPGTRIYVEFEASMVLGEIRHCSQTEDGLFLAGVAILECVPDAREINAFSEIVHKLRWKISSGLRGPAVR